MKSIETIFDEKMREVLWFIARIALQILDYAYGVLMKLFQLDVGDFPFIWNWFKGISILLFFFVLIRLGLMYFKTIYDDEEIEKLSGIGILRRLLTISIVMVMLPVVVPGLSEISSALSENFPAIVGSEEKLPSEIIIEAGMADFGNLESGTTVEYENEENARLIDQITSKTINEVDDTTDKYKYFPNAENIVLVGGLALVCCYCYVFVCIQVAQRMVGLLLKILLAPYALSGLVDAKDNSTSIWFRMVMADILVNFFQMAMIWLSMVTAIAVPLTGLAKGLFFIGAVFAIMHSPAGISQLLGADVGASESFNQIQTGMAFMGAARMVGGVAGAAGSYAGAAGTYGLGRILGGRSLSPAVASGNGRGPMGGTGGSVSGGGMPSFNDQLTPKQLSAAAALGVSNPESMSKGELSQALQNVGAARSYFNGVSPAGESGVSETGGMYPEDDSPLSSFITGRGILGYSDNRLSRDGTLASYMGNSSNVMGRMASNFSSHLYQKAGERLFAPKSLQMQNRAERRTATELSRFGRMATNPMFTSASKPTTNSFGSGGNK